MPLETTTTRLQGITAKSGTKKDGDTWTRYDFQLDGFKRPWSTFNKDLVDMSLQGKMVRVSGSAEDRTFTPADSASPITFTQYTLQNIDLVEGETGNLDDVMAPIAQRENDNAVATQFIATDSQTASTQSLGTSPSDAAKQADIRRAVAFKGAVDLAVALAEAGAPVEPDNILKLTNDFQNILESR